MAVAPLMVNGPGAPTVSSRCRQARWAQRVRKGLVGLLPEVPTSAQRAKGYSLLWAEASDEAGSRAVSRMRTPHAYTLTALTALEVVRRVLAGDVHPGYQTPAKAYGADLVMEIGGVTRMDL